MRRPENHCSAYEEELQRVLDSDEILAELVEKKKIFDYLSNHTGKKISSFSDGFGLFQTLNAENFLNFTLPEWTNSVFPEEITELAIRQCELETSTPILKTLFGGKCGN